MSTLKARIYGLYFVLEGKKIRLKTVDAFKCFYEEEGFEPSAKDFSTLDPQRIHNAVKYAGDRALEVTQNGEVLQGHHRLANAIRIGKTVGVEIK